MKKVLAFILLVSLSTFIGCSSNNKKLPTATSTPIPTVKEDAKVNSRKVLVTTDEAIKLLAEKKFKGDRTGLSLDGKDNKTGYYSISWANPGVGTGGNWNVDPYTGDVYQMEQKVFNLLDKSESPGTSQGDSLKSEDNSWFVGAINDNLKIHMKLTINGNKVSGVYYYDKYKTNIELKGIYYSYEKSFDIEEKESKGRLNAVYICDGLIEGVWTDGKNTYPMYLIKEGSQFSIPQKPDGSIMKWNGDWKGIHTGHFKGSELTIKPIFKNLIQFSISAYSGINSGQNDGFAVLSNNIAVSHRDPKLSNKKKDIYFKFSLNGKGNIEFNTNDPGYCCGMGARYDYEYTQKPLELSPFTAKTVGLVDTDEQEEVFKDLTGDDYGKFLNYAQHYSEAEDIDGFGASVKIFGVNGYGNAAIVMNRAKDNTFWAAVDAGDAIHYYTNDKSTKDIPKTIAKWHEPNKDWKKTYK